MKVTAFVRDDGACGVYRVTQPLTQMQKATGCPVTFVRHKDSHNVIYQSLYSDIIMIPRPSEDFMYKIMESLQEMGKKIIIDYDDDVFNISPLSPHYEDFGIENVNFKVDGAEYEWMKKTGNFPDKGIVAQDDNSVTLELWKDGKNLDVLGNQAKLLQVQRSLKLADMVTVTSEILADHYRQYTDKVTVLPNCIDTELWSPLDPPLSDEVRLFWAGGHSHYEDLLLVKEPLEEIMGKYPQVKLVLLGARFDGMLKDVDPKRIESFDWVPTNAYPHRVRSLRPTIGIIPLVDNQFNRCKSPLKWLEMGALGVPSVTSHVSPYKEIETEDNGLFVENNSPKAWVKAISMLVEDRMLRASMGGRARDYVVANYDAKKRGVDWFDAYNGLLEGQQVVANGR